MDEVFNNPYRILGLITPITSKALTKRVSDLKTFIEFGKANTYPLDFDSQYSPLIRSVVSIEDAERSLESDQDRVFYSLFWFYQYDVVDEMALELLEAGDSAKAYELWSSKIESSVHPKFSWLINLNVLSFFQESTLHSKLSMPISHSLFQVVEQYGTVVSKLEIIKDQVLQANKNTVDTTLISKKLIDQLIKYATRENQDGFKAINLELIRAFSTYSSELHSYAESKILHPYLTEIDAAIKEVDAGLKSDESWKLYGLVELLQQQEALIRELDLYCSDNYKVKSLINEYAKVAQLCSIVIYNTLQDPDFAKDTIEWAEDLPAYGDVKEAATEKKKELEEVIEQQEIAQKFDSLVEYLEKEVYSLADVEWLFNKMIIELKQIQVSSAEEKEFYQNFSSACISKLSNKIFEIYQDALEDFKATPNFEKLNTTLGACISLLGKMKTQFLLVDTDSEAREYISKIYNHISKDKSDLELLIKQHQKPQYLPAVASQNKPVVGGAIYAISNITGINLALLRVGYVIATLFTGFWPLIVVYAALVIIKSFVENNAK